MAYLNSRLIERSLKFGENFFRSPRLWKRLRRRSATSTRRSLQRERTRERAQSPPLAIGYFDSAKDTVFPSRSSYLRRFSLLTVPGQLDRRECRAQFDAECCAKRHRRRRRFATSSRSRSIARNDVRRAAMRKRPFALSRWRVSGTVDSGIVRMTSSACRSRSENRYKTDWKKKSTLDRH